MGNGQSVMVGIDPIVRLEKSYGLSLSLINYLNDYGITTLNHVRKLGDWSTFVSYWLSVDDLDLAGVWKLEWERYTNKLEQVGTLLTDYVDSLV